VKIEKSEVNYGGGGSNSAGVFTESRGEGGPSSSGRAVQWAGGRVVLRDFTVHRPSGHPVHVESLGETERGRRRFRPKEFGFFFCPTTTGKQKKIQPEFLRLKSEILAPYSVPGSERFPKISDFYLNWFVKTHLALILPKFLPSISPRAYDIE